jgi:hypothetical protein
LSFFRHAALAEPDDTTSIIGTYRLACRKKSGAKSRNLFPDSSLFLKKIKIANSFCAILPQ